MAPLSAPKHVQFQLRGLKWNRQQARTSPRKESGIETLRSYSVCCFVGFRFGRHLGL
jgi:hypothetical protein